MSRSAAVEPAAYLSGFCGYSGLHQRCPAGRYPCSCPCHQAPPACPTCGQTVATTDQNEASQ